MTRAGALLAVCVALGASLASAHADDAEARAGDAPATDPAPAPGADDAPAAEPTRAPAAGAPARAAPATPSTGPRRPPRPADRAPGKQEDVVAGGRHWRVRTAQGVIHVWVPEGYERATAGVVVYVHGYWTDADGAWRDHALAQQFRASRQNAMFIVPEAPSSNADRVTWRALTDLRRALTRANLRLPDGPTIVMGHSGAFRTIMEWVDHRHVAQIILLDAMYAGERAFDAFIKSGKRADQHKLIVVAASTAESSRGFARRYKFSVARDTVPATVGELSRRELRARLLYIRSQFDHMAIVTSKKVIPVLLRATPLRAL